ncbi:hypothetical protein GCM10027614_46560 [Micromonospora vulcania]
MLPVRSSLVSAPSEVPEAPPQSHVAARVVRPLTALGCGSWEDRAVPSLFASYLRVYEPLTAFDRDRQSYWRRYVSEGRAVAPMEGPAGSGRR